MSAPGTVVVGSGASAVHFALTLLRRGRPVTLVDVGHSRPAPVRPDLGFAALKDTLEDPVDYFLGRDYEAVLFPGNAEEYYGFPPNKAYVFRHVPQHRLRGRGFSPLASYAAGGLAEAWTGGSYPFNDDELADWPIGAGDLMPWYGEIARRIGVCGAADDLSRFMPVHEHLGAPLRLDEHAARLSARYGEAREKLNSQGCWMGRSRLAVIAEDRADSASPGGVRKGCCYLGRCLWGCPIDSLWTPGVTLRECRSFEGFTYLPGRFVSHFRFDSARRITHVVVDPAGPAGGAGNPEEIAVDRLVLAAGTISSCRIFLESILRGSGERVTLRGLMDNRQILMPFLNLGMIGRPWDPDTYQYHQLALGLSGPDPKAYIHGLVTTLKTALIHPIVQSVPMDLRGALRIFRSVHAALGIVNINFCDSRRDGNTLTLEPDAANRPGSLIVTYAPEAGEAGRLREACARMKRVLRTLGCIVPPGMTHVRPMGASVHYAGLLPMMAGTAPLTTTPEGRSNDFPNLWLVDGTGFPFVPAKNLTFTLMANAARVAAAF